MTEPPRWAEALLRRVVPGEEADVAAGELREELATRARRSGEAAARRWYLRTVGGYVLRAWSVRGVTEREIGGGGMSWMEGLGRDVRWAVRGLARRPTYAAVVVGTLALGMGANSAIFTLVAAHFFEPLPYERPDELALVWESGRGTMEVSTVAPGNYFSWREESESFADIAAYNVDFATLSGDGYAERVRSSIVTPHFFDVLGATPEIGRAFDDASVRQADGLQVVLSHGLWTRRYGGDPSVVGTDIRIDGRPHTVLGVMPARFRQPERTLTWQATELWRPMLLDARRDDHGSRYLRTIGRLESSATIETARQEMAALQQTLIERHPEANRGRSVLVPTLDEYLMGTARPTLLMLLAAGVAVLLIVCANVANLTLARGEERRREFALRAALGSGRARLLRQVLVEGVVLALAGAAVGTALVYASRGLLQSIQSRFFSGLVDVSVDWRIVAFTAAVAVGAGVIFGLPTAQSASQTRLRPALSEGGQRSIRGGTGATRSLLIVGQVALATTLLVMAILLSRSFYETVTVPPGFEPEGVITFSVSVPSATYPEPEEVYEYHRALLAEVSAVPSVEQVGMISDLMFTTENMNAVVEIDGRIADPDRPIEAELHVVTPEYFDVLGIRLVEGELPDGWAVPDLIPVVVNQRMASSHWPDESPVGATFSMSWTEDTSYRVIGVVSDILDDGYERAADPAFFIPFAGMVNRRMAYLVRTPADDQAVMQELRAAVGRIDPDVPASDLTRLESMMAETVARPRAASLIGSTFALLALLVAAAGIYGVLSYLVQARTREIGIRAALGARPSQLLGMVMSHSTRLVALGLVLGLIVSLVAGRSLSSLLFGVRPWDPVSILLAGTLLGGAGLLASWIPARKAVRIDPKEALRSE